jgi:hypothetical protein
MRETGGHNLAHILLKRDVLAGLMFMGFATWGFLASGGLEMGALSEMGPAYFPRIVSSILMLLGIGIALTGFSGASPMLVKHWALRPILMILLASLAFAVLLERAGIVIAISVTVYIGVLAGERLRPLPLIALTAVLIIASVALFIWALGMQIPVWPRFVWARTWTFS